mmetsp:Transcript_114357/g.255210  ORF Transcript_114357/g.255210 Transcript_114357/m.255210 type:complete len:355 (-) Transcript_114357:25-1089(-)
MNKLPIELLQGVHKQPLFFGHTIINRGHQPKGCRRQRLRDRKRHRRDLFVVIKPNRPQVGPMIPRRCYRSGRKLAASLEDVWKWPGVVCPAASLARQLLHCCGDQMYSPAVRKAGPSLVTERDVSLPGALGVHESNEGEAHVAVPVIQRDAQGVVQSSHPEHLELHDEALTPKAVRHALHHESQPTLAQRNLALSVHAIKRLCWPWCDGVALQSAESSHRWNRRFQRYRRGLTPLEERCHRWVGRFLPRHEDGLQKSVVMRPSDALAPLCMTDPRRRGMLKCCCARVLYHSGVICVGAPSIGAVVSFFQRPVLQGAHHGLLSLRWRAQVQAGDGGKRMRRPLAPVDPHKAKQDG